MVLAITAAVKGHSRVFTTTDKQSQEKIDAFNTRSDVMRVLRALAAQGGDAFSVTIEAG